MQGGGILLPTLGHHPYVLLCASGVKRSGLVSDMGVREPAFF